MHEISARATNTVTSEDMDLYFILDAIRKNFLVMLVVICASTTTGWYLAFFYFKPVYESSALLLPVQSTSGSDQAGMAATLLGKRTPSLSDLDLYQSLLRSRTVIRKLILDSIKDSGKPYSKQVPVSLVLNLDTSNLIAFENQVGSIAASVEVGSKESGSGGILDVRFSASSPWKAQQLCNKILSIGQEEIRRIRAERSKLILERLSLVATQSRAEWDSSSRILTWYKDRNRSILLPEQALTLSRFEIERQVKEQKYLLTRKEYDAQVIEREKSAPPMMILDSASLPTRKSKPSRGKIIIIGTMLGLVLGCCMATGIQLFKKARND